jgi:uncharacterized protein YaaN involved in tellurite resistance
MRITRSDDSKAPPPLDEGTAATPDEAGVTRALAELDLEDSHSVLFFGSQVQEQLTEISDSMLDRVKAKDAGPAGDALNDMVLTLRGFASTDLDPNHKTGWLRRLLGKGRETAKIVQRYETVRGQIEEITARLQQHQTALMVDIETLDRLYAANLDYFRALEGYIAAGERKLRELDETVIPQRAEDVGTRHDTPAAQELRDLRARRDDLDRRLHDLRLTRQVTMQSLPSLRLVQENDKSLVGRISSTLVNTVPLWRQQLAQALTIQRARDAAHSLSAANDLTNQLLRANAENLRQANQETRREIERGVFDMAAVRAANEALIATIEDSLRIADEGRAARSRAKLELDELEAQLRESLASAKARENTVAGADGVQPRAA